MCVLTIGACVFLALLERKLIGLIGVAQRSLKVKLSMNRSGLIALFVLVCAHQLVML